MGNPVTPYPQQTPAEPPTRLRRNFTRPGLAAVLLIFVILTTLYSVIVPITQGEDELAHYRYLAFIAQTGRLPINQAEREQAWYRSDWPPLYHLLVGWTVRGMGIDTTRPHLKDVGESPHRRLVGEIFYPRLIIYTEDARWPWQDGILAWHLGRFISIIFSGAALVFTWLTARKLGRTLPHLPLSPPTFANTVTALLAFTPRFLFTSAMLSDDSLFILLSSVFIWLMVRAWHGDDRWWLYVNMGLLLGLSITTKYSTGLFPLLLIPLVWQRARQTGWRWTQAAGRLAAAWLATVLGASWWFGWTAYHFNTIRQEGWFYGLLHPWLASGPDVSMRRVFAFLTGAEFTAPERPAAIEAGTFGDWAVYLFQTFWSVPVLEHDPLFPWAYLLVLAFCLLALAGLWHLWRTSDHPTRTMLALLALTVALLFPFPILRFFLTRNVLETGQGRHILYPAAQAIPILLVLGWLQIAKSASQRISESANGQKIVPATRRPYSLSTTCARKGIHYSLFVKRYSFIFALPAVLLTWSLFQLGYMARTYPNPLPVQTTTFNPASIPQPLTRNFGDDIQLLGYDFQPDPDQAIIHLTLYWRALHQVDQNYRVRVQLVDPADQPRFLWLSHPVNGLYPTRAWDQGDVIRDELPLPLAAVSAGNYRIQIDWLSEAEDQPLTAEPLTIVQFSLPARQPIANATTLNGVDYRLWVDESRPVRTRQTIPLSFQPTNEAAGNLDWVLVGPDNVPRPPDARSEATAIFMVNPDWPGGSYRLQLTRNGQPIDTGRQLFVAAEPRLFSLPHPIEGYTPVEAVFATPEGQPQVKLLGYTLPARRVAPGSGLPLTLYWQSLAPVLGDYVVFDVLLDKNQHPYGGYDRLPREYYSTILWANGEVVPDGFAVPVKPDAPDGVYTLHVGLYALVNNTPVSLPILVDDQPTGPTSVVIGPVKVGGPPPELVTTNPQPQTELNHSFGGQITLLGYDLRHCVEDECAEHTLSPSRNIAISPSRTTLSLTLYWRADAVPGADYNVFWHLRNAAGETVAQKDSPPADGAYPTGLWDPGEIIVDARALSLPGLPPGEYTPVIGLYRLDTGERLPLGNGPENELPLAPVQIEEGE